jgi:hypothetical protein
LSGCAAVEIAAPLPEDCTIIAAAAHRLDDDGYFARAQTAGAERKLSELTFPESEPATAGPVALDLAQCPGLLSFSQNRGWKVVRPLRYFGQYATGGGIQWFARPQVAPSGAVEVWLGTSDGSGWIVTLRRKDGVWSAEEVGLVIMGSG